MIDVNRARESIEASAAPVAQLERNDVWCCADLKDHGVFAGAVDRTGRDEELKERQACVILDAQWEPEGAARLYDARIANGQSGANRQAAAVNIKSPIVV